MNDESRPDSQKSRQELLDEIYLLRDVAGEREQRAQELATQLAEKDRVLAESTASLTQVLASRSWRITAPLRFVARWLQRHEDETPVSAVAASLGMVAPNEAVATLKPLPTLRECEPRGDGHCLFVDVTELAARDGRTGVQRVVREILSALLASPPEGYDVKPVYAADDSGWRHAYAFTARCLGKMQGAGGDAPIDTHAGDVFLGLDHSMQAVIDRAGVLDGMRANGVRVWFVCNDTLPLAHPDWFPAGVADTYRRWFETIVKVADGIACISRATESDVSHWIDTLKLTRQPALRLGHFHLGADPVNPLGDRTVPLSTRVEIDRLRGLRTFLMVGTLEPRKGHAQALKAFNLLWARGSDAVLVIAGLSGWNTEITQRRIRHHEEFGKRLFWFADASDAVVGALYDASKVLLAPSFGEGFGLPLVEAAAHELPILCRDLPVFREVAGQHATYFTGSDAEDLALAAERWLAAKCKGESVRSDTMPRLTWAESTARLLRVVLGDAPVADIAPPAKGIYK